MLQGTAAISDAEDAPYNIESSIRIVKTDTGQLTKSLGQDGNRRRWTWSAWVRKPVEGEYEYLWGYNNPNGAHGEQIRFQNDGKIWWYQYDGAQDGTYAYRLGTHQVFRDPAAWYHIVAVYNSEHDTASERCRLYVNGTRITWFEHYDWPAVDLLSSAINRTGYQQGLGRVGHWGGYSDCWLADVRFIDGLCLEAAAFGSFNEAGAWNPKQFAITAVNNGTANWVGGTSGNWNNSTALMFDGIPTTDSAGNASFVNAGNNATVTLPGSGVKVNSTLRLNMYASVGSFTQYTRIAVNGIDYSFTAQMIAGTGSNSGYWLIPDFGGKTLTSIRVEALTGANVGLAGIEVDGILLTNGKTDPTIARNNVNSGIRWSGYVVSSDGYYSNHDAAKGFQGLPGGNGVATSGQGTDRYFTWTPPGGLAFTDKVEVQCTTDNQYAQIDLGSGLGSDVTVTAGSGKDWQWTTLATGGGAITQIKFRPTGSTYARFSAIRVDGHELIDLTADNSYHFKFNDVTNQQRLGRNSFGDIGIADADGALPIYNTTADSDGYDQGETKGSGYRTDSSAGTTNGTGLVLAVPGDSVSTGTIDVHEQINTGSSNKAIYSTTGDASVVTGNGRFYDKSIEFDGNDIISFAGSDDFDFGSGNFTIEAWVRSSDTTTNYPSIFGCWHTNTAKFDFRPRGTDQSGEFYWIHRIGGSNTIIRGHGIAVDGNWHHIAVAREGNVFRMFLDGKLTNSETHAHTLDDSSGMTINLGYDEWGASYYTGKLNDLRVYKGVAKYTASFTPPKRNEWYVTNIAHAHAQYPENVDYFAFESPTSYEDENGGIHGTYAQLNPFKKSNSTLRQGNLLGGNTANTDGNAYATIKCPSTGKWYCESVLKEWTAAGNNWGIGFDANDDETIRGWNNSIGDKAWLFGGNSATLYKLHGSSETSLGSRTQNAQDVLQCLYDADNGKLYYGINNDWFTNSNSGADFDAANHTWSSASNLKSGGHFWLNAYDADAFINFGQRPFKYTPPLSAKGLCTQNLPDTFTGTEANNPSKYFDVLVYTGTGAADQPIKGLNFQPDLWWSKKRDSDNNSHHVVDAIRGGDTVLLADATSADDADPAFGLTFESDGVLQDYVGSYTANTNGHGYVAWAWDCGAAAATPSTDGSITVSNQWVNNTSGFSMSKYTMSTDGGTWGHGLSTRPDWVIVKRLNSAASWCSWHKGIANTQYLMINDDDGASAWNVWGNTTPTNTVVTVSGDSYTGNDGDTYIAYCWAPIPGYSAFGSYTGNGSTDGKFHYCGFKPRFLVVKMISGTGNWNVFDNKRSKDRNQQGKYLRFNSSSVEGDAQSGQYGIAVDLLSNGWKNRSGSGGNDINQTSANFVWAAFAEHPFKTARAI